MPMKVKKVLQEFKEGKLKSGSGKKVKSRKQAIAIGLSEARKSGVDVDKPQYQVAMKKIGLMRKKKGY